MSSGKNSRSVRVCRAAAGRPARPPRAASRWPSGFTPRTAANSDDTGGRAAIWCATPGATPCWRRPLASVTGRRLASPAIMTEKNTPIDNAVPEFWKVERIPEAAPRWLAGTLPMIEEELGAANIPLPIPFTAMSSAKAG